MARRLMSRLARAVLCAAPLAAALLAASTSGLGAQAPTGTVRGRIIDAATQRPIADAQVGVDGFPIGGITGQNGEYTIATVPLGARTIRVRRIGYALQTREVQVVAGQPVTANFSLSQTTTSLEQVVVTGTAGPVEKRTIGNAISTVNVAEVTERVPIFNVTEALQSRTPGVTLMPASGTVGSSADYRIRGMSSLNGYQPVVFIDGVRMNNSALGNTTAASAGIGAGSGSSTNALDLLNPNEIESIEVIKGPAAATLYGADAANGVIQVITKRGSRGQQNARWTAQFEAGTSEWARRPAANYTTCDSIKQTTQAATFPGCATVPRNTVLVGNPLFDDPTATRSGALQRISLGLRGGADRFSYYVSGNSDLNEGPFYNNYQKTRSARGNFSFAPNDASDVQFNVSFQQGRLQLAQEGESGNALTLSATRGRPGQAPLSPGGFSGWRTIDPLRANAYFNVSATNRTILGLQVDNRTTSWLRQRAKVGMDYLTNLTQVVSEPRSADSPAGLTSQGLPRTQLFTGDYVATASFKLASAWSSQTSAGVQLISSQNESLRGTGTGLGAPDVITIGSAQTRDASNTFSQNNSVGYYLNQDLNFRDRLYLNGAVRADDNSAFGVDFDLITYPKFQASSIIADEPAFTGFFERFGAQTVKLRAAWGQAGRAPAPYSAARTLTVANATLGATTGSGLITSAPGNPGLKPERGEEYEFGFDAEVANGRVGIEFTRWAKTMRDMLVSTPTAPSTGFTAGRLTNLGQVDNSGMEFALNVVPVQRSLLQWTSRLNLSTYHNELVSIDGVTQRQATPFQPYADQLQQHRVGYPLGSYFVQQPRRNPDGSPVVIAGTLQQDTATFLGSAAPKLQLGWVNTLRVFRNFTVYATLDYQGGHYLYNHRLRNQCQTANDNCAATNDPTVRFPKTAADSVRWRELPVRQQSIAPYVQQADFLKLRELSLSYDLPLRLTRRFNASGASIRLAGRNLWMWTKYEGADPEVNSYAARGGTNISFVRADTYSVPQLRRFSAQLNLTF
jgi:TonB-linked SusC/RagA family outer membrane protein